MTIRGRITIQETLPSRKLVALHLWGGYGEISCIKIDMPMDIEVLFRQPYC